MKCNGMLPKMLGRMVRMAICLSLIVWGASAPAQNAASTTKEAAVTHHATGSFTVKIVPQKPDNPPAEAANLGRMSIDKEFHGDLEGTSQGEMLSMLDRASGSGGYVAMERVTGTLGGHRGSFALQHNATMDHGAPMLHIIVVPGSGTGELAGLSGTMKIRIEGGQHFYDFDYELAGAPAAP